MSRAALSTGSRGPATRVRLVGAVAALGGLWGLGSACTTLAPQVDQQQPTALMKQAGSKASPLEVRQRVDTMVPWILAFIEQTADTIRAEATDPEVRRRALQLKIDAVPVVYRAAFQADPLASLLDLWLLSYQLEDCFEVGQGPCRFDAQQPVAIEAARELRETFEEALRKVATQPGIFDETRNRVREVARRVPLTGEGAIARRYSMTQEVAAIVGSSPADAFSVIGEVSLTLHELSDRLNTYIGGAGDLARWQAELLAEDVVRWPEVDGALADLNGVSGSLKRLADTLEPEALDALIDRPLELVREERQVVLDDVERQRLQTLRFVTAERQAVIATLIEAVQAERLETLARVREERLETLVEIDRIRQEATTHVVAEGFRLVDHLVWRMAQLLGGLLVLAALLAWLVLKTGVVRLGRAGGRDEAAP